MNTVKNAPERSKAGLRTGELIVSILFALLPFLIAGLQSLICGKNLLSAAPLWSDEFGYWREMYSVDNCGLNFGSTGCIAGNTAAIGPLGAHGIATLAAWAWYALLAVWRENSIVLANLLMLSAALLAFALLVRPGVKKLAVLAVVMALYNPIVLYAYSSMMELACNAAAILCIALFLFCEKQPSKGRFILYALSVFYCALLRINYISLLLPGLLSLLYRKKAALRVWLASFAAYALFAFAMMKAGSLFCAPYPYGFLYLFGQEKSIWGKIYMFIRHCGGNVLRFCNPLDEGNQFGLRFFMVLLILLLLWLGVVSLKNRKLVWHLKINYLSMLLLLGGNIAMIFVFYDVFDWRDYRTMAPLCLGVIFWLVCDSDFDRQRQWKYAVYACFILLIGRFAVTGYRDNHPEGRFCAAVDIRGEWSELLADAEGTMTMTAGYDGGLTDVMAVPPQLGMKGYIGEEALPVLDDIDYLITADSVEVEPPYEYMADVPGGRQLLKKTETP